MYIIFLAMLELNQESKLQIINYEQAMNKRNVNKRTFRKIILKCHWAQRKVIMHLLNYAGRRIFLISYEAVLPWANAHWLKGKGLFIAVFIIVNLHLILLSWAISPKKCCLSENLFLEMQVQPNSKKQSSTVRSFPARYSEGCVYLCCQADSIMGWEGQEEHRDVLQLWYKQDSYWIFKKTSSVCWWISRWQRPW